MVPAMSRMTARRGPRYGSGATGAAHLGECLVDGGEQRPDVRFEYPSDRADAETVDPGKLAGVDDVSSVAEAAVEFVEPECGRRGVVERSDDVALPLGRQVLAEPHGAHALDERPLVGSVASGASRHATLCLQLT